MPVIRSKEYYKYHTFNTDDVEEFGLEKSIILSNIEKYPKVKKEDLHLHFPYIEKNEFNAHLEELFQIGELVISEADHV